MRRIGQTDLRVFPLCLGGNVFGWTVDEAESFALLDAYAAGGGNFVDTADSYAAWVPGNRGGESESILGRWMNARGNRDRMVIATKVGEAPGMRGLAPDNIRAAAEASLRRLGTDRIDLYYAHFDDPGTPLAETLGAFDELVRAGKVRYIGASNYSAPRLADALAVSEGEGLARFIALQPLYNLVERDYQRSLGPLCEAEELSCIPYRALAKGFLTGKYRPGGAAVESAHRARATVHLNAAGIAVLAALDKIACRRGTTAGAIALAWLAAQPTVVAPIASSRTPDQLRELLAMAEVQLDQAELQQLACAATEEARTL